MTCTQFQALTIVEKHLMVGRAIHIMQSDTNSFFEIQNLIQFAEEKGLFKDVQFYAKDKDTHEGG